MILEWDIPFVLISPVNAADTTPGLGPLPINALVESEGDALGYFLLDPAKCSSGAARRITRNNLAQADGEITHQKFKSGYVVELNVQLWERSGAEGIPACAGALRQMGDILGEYLEAIANVDGQLVWWPSAWPAGGSAPNPRMLDMARSMGPSGDGGAGFVSVVREKDPDGPLTTITFALLSALPYVTDYMNWPDSPDEIATFAEGADGGITVVNAGNVAYEPVLRIYGAPSSDPPGTEVDGFTLVNYSAVDEMGNPLQIVYDRGLPGAFPISKGFWIEIDTFRSDVRMVNAAGTHGANAKACIDVLNTDFFQLEPGNNDLHLHWHGSQPGVKAEVVYRNAWA
jgi:hypothetical protein